ncbi:hypothetical protein J5N97_020229 [Dioscorea zingiberensis]|uniref:CCHC-type domain-containing protein n=1 Tax=Dioscorea zingiberensis TaxID=325984 RepID=A0A9D5HDF9_9LILI|nr:hypothetical protein J5N97_020229 [Dioscorea zingiberensis]
MHNPISLFVSNTKGVSRLVQQVTHFTNKDPNIIEVDKKDKKRRTPVRFPVDSRAVRFTADGGGSMVRAWRRVSERGEGSRNPGRNEDDHIDHKRLLHGRIIVSPEGSPRRDDTSYAEALRRKQPCNSITPCLEEFRPSEYDLPESSKDGPWRKVQSRKRRRTPPTGACIKPRPNRGETQLLRRSPPTKLIAGRVAEVCGNCLQPSHLKAECRKLEVCRRCELAGHRSSRCSVTSSELRRLRRSREEQARMRGRQTLAKAEEGGGHHKQGKEGRGGNQLPGRNPPSEEEVHYIPMPIDDELADEKEKLKSVSIATITKVSDGIADHRKLAAALAECFAPVGQWPVTPLEDDRMVVNCPSAEAARDLERQKELKFPAFTVSFEQWTADLDSPEKAEGEFRWVKCKNVPLYFRKRNTVARFLKPIGDLIILDTTGAFFADHLRALVRIRRGRRLPCTVKCNMYIRRHVIRIELEGGQSPLPWGPAPVIEDGDDTVRPAEKMGETSTNPSVIAQPNLVNSQRAQGGGTVVQVGARGNVRREEDG